MSSPLVQTVKIRKSICLPPQYYNENIYEHLYSFLLAKYLNQCDEENGVFLDILDIRILGNKIGNNCSYTEFFVEMDTKIAKPIKDVPFDLLAESIQESGIYGVVEKKLKIGVSQRYMNGWKYEKNDGKECFKKGDKTIHVGDTIKVKIVLARFSTDKFSCICQLCEE